MRKLKLNDPRNQELIELLKYGTGLTVKHIPNEARIGEIFYNNKGNYFINAMVPVLKRKIISQEWVADNVFEKVYLLARKLLHQPKKMSTVMIERFTWQQATVIAYFSKEDNRVEKAATLPGVTFIPVKGSNMLGILVSEDGCMMTCGIGENININDPIDFKTAIEAGEEVAILRFKWNPMYSVYELESDPKKIDAIIRYEEKLNPVYSQIKRYFDLVVDKEGKPVGQIFDSTMGKYLPVTSLVMKGFEKEFFARAVRQAKEDEREEMKKNNYLRCLGSGAGIKYLIKRKRKPHSVN